MSKTKICRICEIQKPISKFRKAESNKDGHDSRCKKCLNERQKITRKRRDIKQLFRRPVDGD